MAVIDNEQMEVEEEEEEVVQQKAVAKVIAKIVSEIAVKDGESEAPAAGEEPAEEIRSVAAPATVNADGDGPLTQLWYGAFDVEIDTMLKDLSL